MRLHSLPIIEASSDRFGNVKSASLEDIRPLVFRRMAPDLAQERFAEILQLLFADTGNAAKLG
jgi:hypothetical protein